MEEGEVIETIDSIESAFSVDTLIIRVTLTTLSGEQIRIDVPLDTYTYG